MTRGDPPLVECVPNVSEGRDGPVIASLAEAIASIPDVKLLHVDAGADAHRTVFTFAGPPEAAADAALALGAAVARRIDMRGHAGAHPRIGALDVCPFVPLRATTMERCTALSRRVGATLAHDHGVPVFLYEAAAFDDTRRRLPDLRRGELEGLAVRLADPAFQPDFGPARPHPSMGATIVGARPLLVAWNVSLDTTDVLVARAIAGRVRTSGVVRTHANGSRVRTPGRLAAVRAVGWSLPSFGHAQVSLNLLDVRVTPMHVAYRVVSEEAAAHGASVIGSELIGLVPLEALCSAGREVVGDADDVSLVQAGVDALRLRAVRPFDPRERVLEWRLAAMAPGW